MNHKSRGESLDMSHVTKASWSKHCLFCVVSIFLCASANIYVHLEKVSCYLCLLLPIFCLWPDLSLFTRSISMPINVGYISYFLNIFYYNKKQRNKTIFLKIKFSLTPMKKTEKTFFPNFFFFFLTFLISICAWGR